MRMVIALVTLVMFLGAGTSAQTPEEKGLAIAKEADARSDGFGDYTANMVMTLRNKHGQESTRKIRIRVLEVPGDGDKSLSIFDDPLDVKGTAFLTYSHKVGDDDQWLYLPALKRVKRISARNKSGSFMGSEFSYEDIASQEIEKYTYKWLRDEQYDGRECFVIERYPIDKKNSGYRRQVAWMDKEHYRMWKVDYYDRKQSRLKTLTFKGYRLYLETHWRAHEMFMINHQTGKSTDLVWSDFSFRNGLTKRYFDRNSLLRAR